MCHSYRYQLILEQALPAIFVENAWFHRSKRCFVAYDKGFLEISLDDHFCEFRFYRVSHVILQLLKNT